MYVYFAAFRLRQSPESLKDIMLIAYIVEAIFFVDMILNFFKEFTPSHTTVPTSDFQNIVAYYLQNQFIFDLIPLIPL